MKSRWLVIPFLFLLSGAAFADTTAFQAGVNYEAVTPAQPTDVKPGQVEVIEFYWYGCPVCFALEPYVESWEQQLPKGVVFKRVPGAMPDSEFYVDAQATAVAEVLGIGGKIREPLFNAIHENGNLALRTDKAALRDFFGKYGVAPEDFDATWDSAAVQAKLAGYQKLAGRYGIDRVPTIVVDGKWKTGAGYMMPPAKVMDCVDFLVTQEQTPEVNDAARPRFQDRGVR